MIVRTYTELLTFDTFEERFHYLALRGIVSDPTFGFDRYLNQEFYRSREWRELRDYVIVRDNGCDLAIEDRVIYAQPRVHHMNPMTVDDVKHGHSSILNPEYLITTTLRTHNAIHFGDETKLAKTYTPRTPGDTKLW